MLAEVRSKLPSQPAPRDAFRTIADAVRLVCTEFKNDAAGGLISGALAEGSCDCDILTVTYLTVGDALGLPLWGVFLPGHALVVWADEGTEVFWETTTAEERPRWFLEALVPEGAERAYLQPLSGPR